MQKKTPKDQQKDQHQRAETERGCGFRRIGGLYLVCDSSQSYECDAIPLPLIPCGDCGYNVNFSRGIQWIPKRYVEQLAKQEHMLQWSYRRDTPTPECKCVPQCPLCNSQSSEAEKVGLMFVGSKFYTPAEFIKEAKELGVSKRIAEIPKDITIGETWILLASLKVPFHREGSFVESEKHKAIFYAFKPQRLEMPVWKSIASNDLILALEERGITPVILEETAENKKRHAYAHGFERFLKSVIAEKKKKQTKQKTLDLGEDEE